MLLPSQGQSWPEKSLVSAFLNYSCVKSIFQIHNIKSSWPATGFELNERFFDIHMGRVNIQEFQEQKALLQHILEGEMRLLHIKSFLFTINRDVVLDSAWLHNTSKTRRVKNLFYRFLMVSRRRKRKKRTPPHRCKQHCEAPFGIGS